MISCIIPAYNEKERISRVLAAVCKENRIDEIIVVDDASKDSLKETVLKFPRTQLIEFTSNQGKSAAICAGLEKAKNDLVLFLDADLQGLTQNDLSRLINPVKNGTADVSVSLRKNAPWFYRAIGLDFISGERVLKKTHLEPYIEEMKNLRFGLEVFINKIIIEKNLKIQIIKWENVISPYKMAKVGFIKGLWGEIKMNWDIIKRIGLYGSLSQIYRLKKLSRQ